MEDHIVYLQSCMYQYSRAIYRSIKDLIDPYADRRDAPRNLAGQCSTECELTMSRLAADPQYFARPDGRCSWTSGATSRSPRRLRSPGPYGEGVGAADRVHREADRGRRVRRWIARCKATTRKGKACQRTPLPGRDYCPSHQHLEARTSSLHKRRAPANARGPRNGMRLSLHRCRAAPRVRLKPHPTADHPINPGCKLAERCPTTPTSSSVSSRSSPSSWPSAAHSPPATSRATSRGTRRCPMKRSPRRFYSDRAELTAPRRAAPLPPRRVHGRGAVHASLGELLPRPTRPQGRRARGTADGPVLPRRQVRLRRATEARAPEPRTRAARVPRGPHRDRRARARQRSGLFARARGKALEARVGDLEAAHDQVLLLVAADGTRSENES